MDRPPRIEERLAQAGLPLLGRSTWLEIDLSVLAANAVVLREMLPPKTRLAGVVKADGYGHGLLGAAHAALRGGADMLAVVTLDEALALRRAGFMARVLVLYAVPAGALDDAVAAGLDLVVMDDASLAAMCRYLERAGSDGPRVNVHLGVETGMVRGGMVPERSAAAARRMLAAGLPALAGTFSHLARPEDAAARERQVAAFGAALAALEAAGIGPGVRHLNATGGILDEANPAWDMARVGLAFYGYLPTDAAVSAGRRSTAARLRPALTLKARAASIETITAGTSVGYGGEWTAERESRIATVALGYADGWMRKYAGARGSVRGIHVSLVGRVGSDAVAVDVTDVPGFDGADEVVLLAPDGPTTVADLARMRDSIAWEVIDGLGPRLARVYLEAGRPMAVRFLDGQVVLAPGARLQAGPQL
jgi:alanine racemase